MTQSMVCRNCHTPMMAYEQGGVEYDECPRCNAHWFDAGELQNIMRQSGAELNAHHLRSTLKLPTTCRWCETHHADKTVQCKQCNRPLGHHCPRDGRAMLIGTQGNVEIDFCPSCSGIWLDGSEYHLILRSTLDAQAREKSTRTRVLPSPIARPQGMPDWLETPHGPAICQVCGVDQPMQNLHWEHGLLKCTTCLGPVDPEEEARVKRLRERNYRKWKKNIVLTESRPGWLDSLATWFRG